MENGFRVDPTNVLIEQPMIDRADKLVSEEPLLDRLEDENRQDAVNHVAGMMTHNDTCLMLSDEGSQTAITVNFPINGEEEKMIVVRGKKDLSRVVNEVHVIDPENLDELLKIF